MQKYLYCFLLNLLVLSEVTAHQADVQITSIPDTTLVAQQADTTVQVKERSTMSKIVRKTAVPVVLIGLGVTHMEDEGLFEGSYGLRRVVQREYPDYYTPLDDYIYNIPLALTVGLNIGGVKGKHHFAEQALLLGMTHYLNKTITNNLKGITAIDRPDGSNNDAFPSAHTSKAFAYATFFHKEYGDRSVWYSVAGYSAATATGAMRILNDKHWLSDVLAGAGIGILSAEVVYLVYPKIQQIVARSYLKKQNKVIVMPYYGSGAGGMALVWQLP